MNEPHRIASSNIGDFHNLMNTPPLKQMELVERTELTAACVLDELEIQTGMYARIDDILEVIEKRMAGRIRCGRLIGSHKQFLIFRDRSMLVLTPPASKYGGKVSVLPAALSLDLGFQTQNQAGGLLKALVDKEKEGTESLRLVWKGDLDETVIPLPARIDEMDAPLQELLRKVERAAVQMCETYPSLPRLMRPTQGAVDNGLIQRIGHDGLWNGPKGPFYWPSYLESPFEMTPCLPRARELLEELGALALWAFPTLPDNIRVTILSQVGPDEGVDIQCRPPYPPYGVPRREPELPMMHRILGRELRKKIRAHKLSLPVGHRLASTSPSGAEGIGHPIDTVVITRPDCHRALELEQKYETDFTALEWYQDPRPIVARQERLRVGPHPMNLKMAEAPGQPFVLSTSVQEAFARHKLGQLRVAMGGGDRADALHGLVRHVEASASTPGYLKHPSSTREEFRYSLLAGREHDTHLRRPIGYITLSGALREMPGSHPSEDICGRKAMPYSLYVNLDRLAADHRVSTPDPRPALIAAATHAIIDLLSRLWEQAEERDVHFEIDIVVDTPSEQVPQEAAEMFTSALFASRARIAQAETFATHLSIGNIRQDWLDGSII